MPSNLDLFAIVYFAILWVGYARFTHYRAKSGKHPTISRNMRSLRVSWMNAAIERDIRIPDATLLSSQERVASFFASASMLILAALMTTVYSPPNLDDLLAFLPFAEHQSPNQIRAKLLMIVAVFVYAFFKFTWGIRQYGFVSVMIGAMPDQTHSAEMRQSYAKYTAKVMDNAAIDSNLGLRAYYFAMALMSWLISPVSFLVVTTLVVIVLYHRECHSRTISNMHLAVEVLNNEQTEQ